MSLPTDNSCAGLSRDGGFSRSTAVLGVTQQQLAYVLAGVGNSELGTLLGYLSMLLDWVRKDLARGQRLAERTERLMEACCEAEVDASAATKLLIEANREAASGSAASRACVLTVLAETVTHLVEGEPASEKRTGPLLRQILDDLAYVDSGTQTGAAGTADPEVAKSPQLIEPHRVGEYLRRRLGRDDVVVESVVPGSGGISMQTYFLTYLVGGRREDVVMRQVPVGVSPQGLVREYGVLLHVRTAQLPIPEPRWLEESSSELGMPFMVSSRAHGVTLGTFAAATMPVEDAICEELARLLARLHALDASTLGAAPIAPMRNREEIQEAIAGAERMALSTGPIAPRFAAILAWLRASIPISPPRPSLLHGDLNFSNVLAVGGKLTALLDWERAHSGDPAEDFAYFRPSLEPIFDWGRFCDIYEQAGGRMPHPDSQRFYTVWQNTWRYTECLVRAANFDASPTLHNALPGFVLGPQFLDTAVRYAFPA
jgi:aminoglycoside phosphotransferase (APT) family kinase protein